MGHENPDERSAWPNFLAPEPILLILFGLGLFVVLALWL